MAPAIRILHRYPRLSLFLSALLLVPLALLLAALTGIGPHPLTDASHETAASPTAGVPPGAGAAMDDSPVPADAVVPAEFEKQAAIMLGCNELVQFYPDTMVELIRAMKDSVRVLALVDDAAQAQMVREKLTGGGLSAADVTFVVLALQYAWVRDYGPVFMRTPEGKALALDPEYPEQSRRSNDGAPRFLAQALNIPVVRVPLTMAGGNLLHNGEGVCVSTTLLVTQNARRGSFQQLARAMSRYFRARQWVYLPPLMGEPTSHADMFATFVRADTVVLGRYEPTEDPLNASILDSNAETLSRTQVGDRTLKVVRIPMPTHRDGVWRTYTNVIYANGTLIVPTYPDVSPELDKVALETYRQVLPDWKVVGVPASGVAKHYGSFHCVSLNIPEHQISTPAQ